MSNSKAQGKSGKNGMGPHLIKGLQHYTQISSRVFACTLVGLLLFAVPGYLLDSYFETQPWIFLTSILLSLPFSLVLVHRVMSLYLARLIKD